MTSPTLTVRQACQLLKKRVRFNSCELRLPNDPNMGDTEKIRDATRLYMETWVLPLLDCIETGDTNALKRLI